ncbi:PQQ-binding-like beta-propeller repeat protein [Actinoallomurus iriomotensis]|uniref:outer membrane protein assembly factor BamB family protein n=1 Tax=Actinoallomurus iriomotensis TaxID=478107 RepID=UPI0032DB766D
MWCIALAATACSGGGRAADPQTGPLSADGLACPDHARRDCLSPGTVRWSVPLDGAYGIDYLGGRWPFIQRSDPLPPGLPAAAVTSGSTLVVNENGLMRAVDWNNGRQLWRTRIAANVRNTIGKTLLYDDPVMGDGLVAVSTAYGSDKGPHHQRVYVVDAVTGRQVSDHYCPAGIDRLVAIVGGRLIWTNEARVTATDARSGKTVWRQDVRTYWGMRLIGDLLYFDDHVSTGKKSGIVRHIQRIDLRAGRRLADLSLPRGLRGDTFLDSSAILDPVHLPGILFLAMHKPDGEAAIDSRTGHLLWRQAGVEDNGAGNIIGFDVLARPPTVYLNEATKNTAQAVNAENGSVIHTHIPSSRLKAADAAVRGVAADTTATTVYGFDLVSGGRRWRVPEVSAAFTIAEWVDGDSALLVATGCATDGVTGSRCTKPRLFAVNW